MVLTIGMQKKEKNIIGALVNNSLTACGTVNGNVDSDTFNIDK